MDLAQAHPRIDRNGLRDAAFVVAGAVAIFALNFIPPFDNALPPIVLFGPLLTGIIMRLGGWPWKLGAASWALMGLISLFWDWILYDEDKAFHVALTVGVVVLVALGAAIGRGLLSARSRFADTNGRRRRRLNAEEER
jgi:hypothetical protein